MEEYPRLSKQHCRGRQQRLRESLAAINVDRAIVVASESVQWLTGFRPHPLMRAAAILETDGPCTLIAPGNEPDHHAADQVRIFDAQWLCTLRQDQFDAAMQQVTACSQQVAVEFSACGQQLAKRLEHAPTDVDPLLWDLRRRKDPDELAMMRKAISCTEAMYHKAREIIRPGIGELEVYNQLHAAAVQVAGEPLTALGNDYQSNSPGGLPRDRPAQAGELMILDLGPAYRGYHADNCRTFAVDGQPTETQERARQTILSVFEWVEKTVRPGVSCRQLYDQCKAILDQYEPNAFFHHLGHGVGLYPHEAPHLNPHWDDHFRQGDFFTVEPGLYGDALRAGIRIEENYLVTATGVEKLTTTSTEL